MVLGLLARVGWGGAGGRGQGCNKVVGRLRSGCYTATTILHVTYNFQHYAFDVALLTFLM